jgi:TonB family protein
VPAKTLVAQTPEVPSDVQAQGYMGTAKVKVDLDASGDVVGTSIYTSTGSMELDRAALAAARASRYAPEQRECKNVPGSYLFIIDFE